DLYVDCAQDWSHDAFGPDQRCVKALTRSCLRARFLEYAGPGKLTGDKSSQFACVESELIGAQGARADGGVCRCQHFDKGHSKFSAVVLQSRKRQREVVD